MHQILIPSSGEPNRLGENRGIPRPGDAVKAFVPPVVRRNAKTVNGRSDVEHLRDLLVEGHAANQIIDSLFNGQAGVEIWRMLLPAGLAESGETCQAEYRIHDWSTQQRTNYLAHGSSLAQIPVTAFKRKQSLPHAQQP